MVGASTIVIALDDLSIPGSEASTDGAPRLGPDIERTFFELVGRARPHVVVLDCRGTARNGVGAIETVRKKINTPILVVCEAGDPLERDYRVAGAADCLASPFDILRFNQTIQQIIRLAGAGGSQPFPETRTYRIADIRFQPRENVISANGMAVKLTTAENRLLMHLLSRPWTVCSRVEITDILYGAHRPSNDRAIDVVVTRLRKKLAGLRGLSAGNLIRTEFRSGYMFVGEVSAVTDPAESETVVS
jgi:two-component system OmpR family response regulator